MTRKFAHIVNPVEVENTSDLFIAQPITFETIRLAQDHAAVDLDISLFAAYFPEDRSVVPPFITSTPELNRSVLDVAQFRVPRKLPLLRDILDRLFDVSDADYFIYTNIDIALQPTFYRRVNDFIDRGFDSFVINRRTISDRYADAENLPDMFREPGIPHRGWDCFIFPRSKYPEFKLFDVCLGASRVGLALLANLVAHSNHFQEFRNEHLTFHIGDNRSWLRRDFADYDAHNTAELLRILGALEKECGPFARDSVPGSFLYRRRIFGRFYDAWSRHVYLPVSISQILNRLSGRR